MLRKALVSVLLVAAVLAGSSHAALRHAQVRGMAQHQGTSWAVNMHASRAYATALCAGLRHEYAGVSKGTSVSFAACKDADRDPTTGTQFYWVFVSVKRGTGPTKYFLVKVYPDGAHASAPIVLTKDEYDQHVAAPAA